MAYRTNGAEHRPTFSNLRPIDDIDVMNDRDTYGLGPNGEVYQKKTSFKKSIIDPEITWVPVEGGFCQQISDEFEEDLENHGSDPRVACSAERKKWGGNPDERNYERR